MIGGVIETFRKTTLVSNKKFVWEKGKVKNLSLRQVLATMSHTRTIDLFKLAHHVQEVHIIKDAKRKNSPPTLFQTQKYDQFNITSWELLIFTGHCL